MPKVIKFCISFKKFQFNTEESTLLDGVLFKSGPSKLDPFIPKSGVVGYPHLMAAAAAAAAAACCPS
jgi:hypothetical protein